MAANSVRKRLFSIMFTGWAPGFSRLAFLVVGVVLAGCLHQDRYSEQYELSNLKVIFLDQQSLREALDQHVSEEQRVPVYPLLSGAMPPAKVVKGFFDFNTNTLFCSKWDYEVCGHELHHAVLGQFHGSQ